VKRLTPIKAALGALVLAALLIGPDVAVARKAKPPAPAASSSVASSMGALVQPPAQRLAAALAQIGLTACAAPVMQAAGFLFEDGQANFTVQPLGPGANRWPTVVVIEGAHASLGKTRLSILTISPGAGCSGFYTQTIYWDRSCPDLKRTVFSPFTVSGVLLTNVQVSELNAGVQLYLTPAGKGCVSVKKELFR